MTRRYFFDRPRADAPPLGYPPDPARIPDDWTVWALGDVHGVASGLQEALEEAGLIDGRGVWAGGSKVALIGLGDYIDRGRDSAGVIDLFRVLELEMAAAGSRLVLVRGNHEQMLADILRGQDEWFESWAANGGHALARSYGLPGALASARSFADSLFDRAPFLLEWLLATVAYARWRDVIFVHAGLPDGATPGSLLEDDRQLWDPDAAFFSGAGLAFEPGLAGFRTEGLQRVVIGHYPQDGGPTVEHGGTLLLLDTDAAGTVSRAGAVAASFLTLAQIPPDRGFETAKLVMVNTSDAPDRAPE